MKSKYFLTLLYALLISTLSKGQSIPTTSSASGWSGNPTVSDLTYYGGQASPTTSWSPGPLPALPGGNGDVKFLSVNADKFSSHSITANITGLTTGSRYRIKYYVSTAVHFNMVGVQPSAFGKSCYLTVPSDPWASTQVIFSPGINTHQWVPATLDFFANASTVQVNFIPVSDAANGSTINLHILPNAIQEICSVLDLPVVLDKSVLLKACPTQAVNLNKAYTKAIPSYAELVWYTTATPSPNTLVANPASVSTIGDFYAFFKDKNKGCLSTNNSLAKLTVKLGEITLASNTGQILCAGGKYDLTKLVTTPPQQIPDGAEVRWFNNSSHQGTPIADPTAVGPGTYCAFFYVGGHIDCYNTIKSLTKVVVSEPTQVDLGYNSAPVICPTGVAPLPTGADGGFEQGQPGKYLRYFKTNDHSGTYYSTGQGQTPKAPVGDYYVFVYDEVRDCYNVNTSTEKFSIFKLPDPVLKGTSISNSCPATSVNLNSLVDIVTPTLRWFKNSTHTGNYITDPTKVSESGTYYLFNFDPINDCYNTNNSTSLVNVTINTCAAPCLAGTNQVSINGPTTFYLNTCNMSFDLMSVNVTSVPAGCTVAWFLDAAHTKPVPNPSAVSAGLYYAFYFDSVGNCYNTNSSTTAVTVGYRQVPILKDSLSNTCPETTVNLNSAVAEELNVSWYTSNNHSTPPIADPQHATAGIYYAFLLDPQSNCYNVNVSIAKVTVTTSACNNTVQLSLKVALQGSMPTSGTVMRNDLQKYTDGVTVGVLPKTDPYANGAVYNDINNTAVGAGNVVDWVKVDIKSATAPYSVLQSKSLLLRPDGSVVDVNGLIPVFDAQVGEVFIVVRHRNHLAIMSNAMPFVAGQVNFDFTDNLGKAFNDGSVPTQMRLINGIWCMINGDVNQDNYVQNNDISQTRNSFKQGGVGVYSARDLNMNGYLENTDATAQRNRYQTGFTSILSKY